MLYIRDEQAILASSLKFSTIELRKTIKTEEINDDGLQCHRRERTAARAFIRARSVLVRFVIVRTLQKKQN